MLALNESDIPAVLAPLSMDACDVLMKYLYKLMANKVNKIFITISVYIII